MPAVVISIVVPVGFASQSELQLLLDQPCSTYLQFGPDARDGPALLNHAGVQVGGEVGEAELGKARLALRLPHTLACAQRSPGSELALGDGLAGPADLVVVQQPPHGPHVDAQLADDLGLRPRLRANASAR